MKITMKTLVAYLAVSSLVGCGSKDDSSSGGGDDEEAQGTTEILDDSELRTEAVSSTVDVGISAAAEGTDESSASALALASNTGTKNKVFTRECEEDGDTAVVTISREFSRTREITNKVREISMSMSGTNDLTRTWSSDEGAVKCHSNGKHIDVAMNDMEGMILDVDFKREGTRTATFTNVRKGITVERYFKFTATGKRHIEWTDVSTEGDNTTLSTTNTSEVDRSTVAKNKDGEERTMEMSVDIGKEDPLVVDTVRDSSSRDIVSRTIKSGTITSTNKDKGKLEIEFDTVVYTPDSGCLADSGSISGKVFKPEADEATMTFEITFSNGSAKIEYSDGTSADYTPEGCDLENPEPETETE